LTGNLYSRVDTADWPEKEGKKNAKKQVDDLFDGVNRIAKKVWVPQVWIHPAESKGIDFSVIPNDQVFNSLKAHAPNPPYETAIASVRSAVESLVVDIRRDQFSEIASRLKSDRAFQILIAAAVSDIAARHITEEPALFQFSRRLAVDGRFEELAADSIVRFAHEFARMREVPKGLTNFLTLFAERSLFDELSLARVGEAASDLIPNFSDLQMENFVADLGAMGPTGAIVDLIQAMSYEAICRSMPNNLISRLKNDPSFRGSIKKHV
jgi:hypothetical protein